MTTKKIVPPNTHLRIADELRTAIKNGEYTERLPTAGKLAEAYDVSRALIGRSMSVLELEGLVESHHGIGWFVAGSCEYRPADVLLRRMIMTGGYVRGSRFPSEGELCKQFGVSRTVIRSAIARLQGEQILSEVIGRYRDVLAIPLREERP